MSYFNTKRDNALIESGTHFWCHACLVARPNNILSPDLRYCFPCYDLLLTEAAHGRESGKIKKKSLPYWIPATPTQQRLYNEPQPVTGVLKTSDVYLDTSVILATVNEPENTVAKKESPTPKIALSGKPETRGRPQVELPEEAIIEMAKSGMGYKRIAARLNIEYGIDAKYRTIARVVKGERNDTQEQRGQSQIHERLSETTKGS